mmetsp:Transcript_71716/g.201206  ORF Transcript_71716/g.201206 Transcript_71716/m.201206 type:complete len:341 (+) Transcript_71716:1212-2234(+)
MIFSLIVTFVPFSLMVITSRSAGLAVLFAGKTHWSKMSPICWVSGCLKSRPKDPPMSSSIGKSMSSMIKQTLESTFETTARSPPTRNASMAKYHPQHQVQQAQRCVTLLYLVSSDSADTFLSSHRQNQVKSNIMQAESARAMMMMIEQIHITVFGPSPARWPRSCRNLSVSVKKLKVSRMSSFTSASGIAACRNAPCKSLDISGLSCLSISFRAPASAAPTPLSNTSMLVASAGDKTWQNSHLCLLLAISGGMLSSATFNNPNVSDATMTDSLITAVLSICARMPSMKPAVGLKLCSMLENNFSNGIMPRKLGFSCPLRVPFNNCATVHAMLSMPSTAVL